MSTYEIRSSLPAAEDLERICERVERDNPEAARRIAKTIYGRRCMTVANS
jgi:plasmid stabilization system protein ParE